MRLSDVQFRKLLSELRINEEQEIMVDWKQFLQVFNLHKQEVRIFLWLSFYFLHSIKLSSFRMVLDAYGV